MNSEIRSGLCKSCGAVMRGRSDKKFCNDYCRNAFHNQANPSANIRYRNINRVLLKNRRILECLLPDGDGMVRVSREQMLEEGFRFQYLTHEWQNASGSVFRFCYDHGYLPLDEEWVLIVKREDC